MVVLPLFSELPRHVFYHRYSKKIALKTSLYFPPCFHQASHLLGKCSWIYFLIVCERYDLKMRDIDAQKNKKQKNVTWRARDLGIPWIKDGVGNSSSHT